MSSALALFAPRDDGDGRGSREQRANGKEKRDNKKLKELVLDPRKYENKEFRKLAEKYAKETIEVIQNTKEVSFTELEKFRIDGKNKLERFNNLKQSKDPKHVKLNVVKDDYSQHMGLYKSKDVENMDFVEPPRVVKHKDEFTQVGFIATNDNNKKIEKKEATIYQPVSYVQWENDIVWDENGDEVQNDDLDELEFQKIMIENKETLHKLEKKEMEEKSLNKKKHESQIEDESDSDVEWDDDKSNQIQLTSSSSSSAANAKTTNGPQKNVIKFNKNVISLVKENDMQIDLDDNAYQSKFYSALGDDILVKYNTSQDLKKQAITKSSSRSNNNNKFLENSHFANYSWLKQIIWDEYALSNTEKMFDDSDNFFIHENDPAFIVHRNQNINANNVVDNRKRFATSSQVKLRELEKKRREAKRRKERELKKLQRQLHGDSSRLATLTTKEREHLNWDIFKPILDKLDVRPEEQNDYGDDEEEEEEQERLKKEQEEKEKEKGKKRRKNAPVEVNDGGFLADTSQSWTNQLPPKLLHSEPAVNLKWAKPFIKDPLKNWHRPTSRNMSNRTRIIVEPPLKKDKSGRSFSSARAWKEKELSLRNGKFVLLEYSEQYPLLVNNIGMASNFCNFYRLSKRKAMKRNFIPPRGRIGKTIVLKPKEKSPFLYKLDENRLTPAIHNNMFVAPTFRHEAKSTDFLLVRSRKPYENKDRFMNQKNMLLASNGGNADELAPITDPNDPMFNSWGTCFLRPLNDILLVGQTEPRGEIFQPNVSISFRSDFLSWLVNYVSFFIAKQTLKRNNYLKDNELEILFPTIDPRLLQKANSNLIEYAKNSKTGEEFKDAVKEFTKTLIPAKLKPEDVCSWEAVQLGLAKLFDANIFRTSRNEVEDLIHHIDSLTTELSMRMEASKALEESIEEVATIITKTKVKLERKNDLSRNDKQLLSACRFLLKEIRITPWHLSKCYKYIHLQPNPKFAERFKLTGLGDPTGVGEGYSFLDEQAITATSKKKKEKQFRELQARVNAGVADESVFKGNLQADANNNAEAAAAAAKLAAANKAYIAEGDKLSNLSMKKMGKILKDVGVDSDYIVRIERWDRVWLIKKLANSPQGTTLLDGLLAKYRRAGKQELLNANTGFKNQGEAKAEYQRKIQRIFKTQEQVLSDKIGPKVNVEDDLLAGSLNNDNNDTHDSSDDDDDNDDDDDDDDEDIANFATQLEQSVTNVSNLSDRQKKINLIVPPRPDWKPFKVLKRTVVEDDNVTVEYIKEPRRVQRYIALQKELEISRRLRKDQAIRGQPPAVTWLNGGDFVGSGRGNIQVRLDETEAAQIKEARSTVPQSLDISTGTQNSKTKKSKRFLKEAAKLEEEERKKKVIRTWYQELVKEFGDSQEFLKSVRKDDDRYNWPEELPVSDSGRHCKRCFLIGHISTNGLCPLNDPSTLLKNPAIQAEGTKVKIDRLQMQRANVRGSRASRKRPNEYADITINPAFTNGGSNKRGKAINNRLSNNRGRFLGILNDKLKELLDELAKTPVSAVFRKDVTRKQIPDYHSKVKTPLSLNGMSKAIHSKKYTSKEDFLLDLQLLIENSVIYNGPNSPITDQARRLKEIALHKMSEMKQFYVNIENSINQASGGKADYNGIHTTYRVTNQLIPKLKEDVSSIGGTPLATVKNYNLNQPITTTTATTSTKSTSVNTNTTGKATKSRKMVDEEDPFGALELADDEDDDLLQQSSLEHSFLSASPTNNGTTPMPLSTGPSPSPPVAETPNIIEESSEEEMIIESSEDEILEEDDDDED